MIKTPYLLALCFTVPTLASAHAEITQDDLPPWLVNDAVAEDDSPEEAAPAVQTTPPWGTTRRAGNCLIVNFPEPMVAESEVDKEVQVCNGQDGSGYYRVEGTIPVKAKWISTSSFSIEANAGRERCCAKIIVPEGLRALSGTRQLGWKQNIGNDKPVSLRASSFCVNQETELVFITATNLEDIEHLEKAVGKAYFKFTRAYRDDNGDAPSAKHEPATLRPATFGDAQQHWESFKDIFGYPYATAEDEELVRSRNPEEILPGLWCVAFPAIPEGYNYAHLMIPGLGRYNTITKLYQEVEACYFTVSNIYAFVTSKRTGEGVYQLRLHCRHSLSADVDTLFRNAAWEMTPPNAECYIPMVWDEARQAFTAKVEGRGDVVLTLDKEATLAKAKDIPLPGGGKVRGVSDLIMKAETPAPGVRIRSLRPITSLYGATYAPVPTNKNDGFARNMSTRLVPDKPVLLTDMRDSGLRGGGTRRIHCRTVNVSKVRAKVYRIESQGDATPRLLTGYAKLYKGGDTSCRNFIEDVYGGTKEKLPCTGVPTALLPGMPAKAETELTPDAQGECTLDPAALFPGMNPHATYFVNLEADVAPEADEGKYVLNQGVVQVTDLGLMWKLSTKRLFGYVYRLSDGKPVAEATLHFLDGDGAEIGTMAAKDGIATGDMPEGAKFIQVRSGDDCYTTRISKADDRIRRWTYVPESELLNNGIDPAKIVQLQTSIFTDRSIYRKGETAHIKGMLRFLQANTLSIPDVESITASVHGFDGESKKFDAQCGEDGSFSVDIPISDSWNGHGYVEFSIKYKGDADRTTPDLVSFKAAGMESLDHPYLLQDFERENRLAGTNLIVEDFRRNEFEVTSTLDVDPETRTAKLTAGATDFNTTPVASGKVHWMVWAHRVNFYPVQFKDYRFGDQIESDDDYFGVYYAGRSALATKERRFASNNGVLDAQGKGSAELVLPDFEHPGRYIVSSSVAVTNGNEQTLYSERKTTVEASGVYAGISGTGKLARAGETLQLGAILVTPEGKAWGGAPLPATVKVKRTVFHPYRYGSMLRSSIRNEKVVEEYPAQEIMLGGEPTAFEVPTTSAGTYDIVIEGKDADGKPYYTAVRKYVWGGDVSPWEYGNGTALELTPDKEVYQVGDTAKILVQTPVDAELLVTVERENVQRHYIRRVTVADPVLELPIETADAPFCRVSVFLVQGADARGKNSAPVIKHATADIHVDMPEKRLSIEIEAPAKAIQPTDECTLAGVVKDAAGTPVANAAVTLYAEDEGTLQVMGYTNPAPYADFYKDRMVCVATFHTLGQLLGDVARSWDYGNKGIFVGGGDECVSSTNASADRGVRKDFNPCALWLTRITTDEQGRFRTTFTNPDTMTRYRVIAVAAAGVDKFGTAESSYLVAQPVMLAPSAPLFATQGDCLDVPVTLTMLPDMMPDGTGCEVKWDVSLQGTGASVPEGMQTVTLSGNAPATIHFPVTMDTTGPVELTWSVAPAAGQPGLEKMKDAVQLGFEVVPPTPHLRLPLLKTLKPGQKVKPATLLSQALRPESKTELTVSLSPLSGAAMGVDYLFNYPHGCVEQLSSALLPWLLRDTLQKWVEVPFPADKDPDAVISKSVDQILKRQRPDGGFRYWDGAGEASEFSPYVYFVLSYCDYARERTNRCDYLKAEALRVEPAGNLLAFWALARWDASEAQGIYQQILDKRTKWSAADRLIFACAMLECCERLSDKIQPDAPIVKAADKAVAAAEQAVKRDKGTRRDVAYSEPPMDALRMIFDIKSGKNGQTEAMHRYIRSAMAEPGYYTTLDTAWACIAIQEFCNAYSAGNGLEPITVNGQQVELGKPWRINAPLRSMPDITVKGKNPGYISGIATGYTVVPQKVKAVDKGFLVQRSYERLLPDGSWQPTSVFEVGDIVRVSFSAVSTVKAPGRFMVAEDRLPAGFEAVNPTLITQSLPEEFTREPARYWYSSAFVDRTEYHKDRVCFFAQDFAGGRRLEASYIARVVKSGRMTAPAAKVEMMYAPGIYGLSIPQEFTVSPRLEKSTD